MKTEGSLPCSRNSAQDPILKEPNQVLPIDPYLSKVHLNIIFPYMPRSSQWSRTHGYPNQDPVNTSPLPMRATCSADLILLDSITLKIIRTTSTRHGASSGCGWREGFQLQRVAANILKKQSQRAGKGWPRRLGLGVTQIILTLKKSNMLRNIPKGLELGLIL